MFDNNFIKAEQSGIDESGICSICSSYTKELVYSEDIDDNVCLECFDMILEESGN